MRLSLKNILSIVIPVVLLSGCSAADSNAVDTQRTNIVNYLENNNFDYQLQAGVYKYTTNSDRDGYENAVAVNWGDSVAFMFAIYNFSSSIGELYFTNMEQLLSGDTILNKEYWSFNPKKIKLGNGEILSSVESGLVGSREGDSVLLFLTSNIAYGKKNNGLIPANTSVVWTVKIDEVKKQN